MDEYGKMGSHKHKKARLKGKLAMVGIAVIVILIAGFAYFYLGGPINVSGPTTLTVSSQGTVFALGGKSYVATLAGYSNTTKTAYIYLSSVPVFLGPDLNITLHNNASVKVNYVGQYAIMQMTFVSGNKNSAQVQVTPLALALQISPDYQYIGHPAVPLPGVTITVSTTIPGASTTVAATTTVSSSGGSTTIPATTTVQAVNYTSQAIQTAIGADENYALLLNFTNIYDNSVNCTPHAYNLSYFEAFAEFPVPPADYNNVSIEVPYGMTQKIVNTVGNNYNYEFISLVKDPTFNGSKALTIGITVSSAGSSSALAIVNSDNYSGIFKGATYSVLKSQYQQAEAASNPECAVMIG
jgi:hypothetical protein